MSDLVHVTPASHTFELIPSADQLAERIARTDFVPDGLKGNPPAIMAAILKGHEVGMAPMQSLSQIHVIKGRPTISAEGQRALVLAAGHSIRVKALTPEKCTLVGTRDGESEGTEITFTLAEAKSSGITNNPSWKKHPTDMLLARATTRLCRAVFADVTAGLASTEEIEDWDDAPVGGETVTRQAPAKKRAARKKAAPKPVEEPPAADLPPLPHELDGKPTDPDDDIVDAEIIDDDKPADLITDAQKRKMMALFGEAGITDREDRMTHVVEVIGHDIESSALLTKDEASKVIDDLAMITGEAG